MVVPPLPSLLIALGLLLTSVLIMNRVRKPPLFVKGRPWLLGCAVILLAVGFALHFREPLPERPGSDHAAAGGGRLSPDGAVAATASAGRPSAAWSFSFDPKAVRWGDEVRIRVTPEKQKVTVYYNGTPLPARALGKGVFAVTIPSISKSGYFTLERQKTRVKAAEERSCPPVETGCHVFRASA